MSRLLITLVILFPALANAAPITAEFSGTMVVGSIGQTVSTFQDPALQVEQNDIDSPFFLRNSGFMRTQANTADGEIDFGHKTAGAGIHSVTSSTVLSTSLSNSLSVPTLGSLEFTILPGLLSIGDYFSPTGAPSVGDFSAGFEFGITVNGTSVVFGDAMVNILQGTTTPIFSISGDANALSGISSEQGSSDNNPDIVGSGFANISWGLTTGVIDLGLIAPLGLVDVSYFLRTTISGSTTCNTIVCGNTAANFDDPGRFGSVVLYSLHIPPMGGPDDPDITVAVPEPDSMALLLLGLVAFGFVRSRGR